MSRTHEQVNEYFGRVFVAGVAAPEFVEWAHATNEQRKMRSEDIDRTTRDCADALDDMQKQYRRRMR